MNTKLSFKEQEAESRKQHQAMGGVVRDYGTHVVWMMDGVFHREDGPAVAYTNGDQTWYHHNQIHRLDGPAVVGKDSREWFLNDRYHRLDGPAIVRDGKKQWFVKGHRHRTDGPAITGTGIKDIWALTFPDELDEFDGFSAKLYDNQDDFLRDLAVYQQLDDHDKIENFEHE